MIVLIKKEIFLNQENASWPHSNEQICLVLKKCCLNI